MRLIRPPFWFKAAVGAKTASGTPQAETATSTGSVERVVTVSGTPQAATATSTGSVERVVTVSGTPQAETATSTGSVERAITVSGTPQAETATSTGAVERILTVSGTPQAETATSSGTATVFGVVTASGTPQAATATSTGSVERILTVAGTPQAVTATSTGSATVTVPGARTASGTPQAETATAVGFALVPSGRFGEFDRDNIIKPETFGVIIDPECSTKIADECFSFAVKAQCTGIDIERCNISLIGKILVDKEASGNPQAETATSSGLVNQVNKVSGSPQAETATSSGIADIPFNMIEASGTPQAATATSIGVVDTDICDPDFGPSDSVTWTPGLNTPAVDGAKYTSTTLDVTVSDSSSSTINTIQTDTGKYYAEFEVRAPGSGTGSSQQFYGWKRSAILNNATTSQSVCCSYNENLTVWRVNRDMLSQNQFTFDVQEAAPSACTIVGVAIDASANKCYVQINGNWQTSNSGTLGGLPSGGAGWDITNPNQIAVLWSGTTYQNATNAARNPQYTPSGYTEVT